MYGGKLQDGAADGRNRRDRIAFAAYVLASGFCVLFSRVYLVLSNGVSSPWMVWLPLAPAMLGMIPFAAMTTLDIHPLPRVSFNAWNCFAATVAAGSCMMGILDIAESTTPVVCAYIPFSLLCGIVAVSSAVAGRGRAEG